MFNGTNKVDIRVKHLEDTVIVFEGPTVGKCDRAIWVRKDWYDNHNGEECASADHWKVEDRRMLHVDADHGSHVVQGPGLRNSTTIALEGVRDSADYLADDPALESTGTYALCLANFPGNADPATCDTWTPGNDDYTYAESL